MLNRSAWPRGVSPWRGKANPGFRGAHRKSDAHISPLRHELDSGRPMGRLESPRSHGRNLLPRGGRGWPLPVVIPLLATPSLRYDLPGALPANQDIMLTTELSV